MTVDHFQQFLFWVSQRHKLMTTCVETKLKLCEDIKQLRSGNRERQKRIGELSNVSRKSGSRKSGTKCVAEVLPNIEAISEQVAFYWLISTNQLIVLFLDFSADELIGQIFFPLRQIKRHSLLW